MVISSTMLLDLKLYVQTNLHRFKTDPDIIELTQFDPLAQTEKNLLYIT